jgi:predicted dehydrogenase
MEAVWTRYFPISIEIRKLIEEGKIGEVIRVQSDLSIGDDPEEAFDVSHRMVNKDLAGGALLDLGIYSLTWQFQTIYHTLPKEKRKPPKVVGSLMTLEPRTGADEATTVLLNFPVSTPSGKRNTHGIATTAFRAHFDYEAEHVGATPAVRIFGEEGEIQVFGPIYRPTRYRHTFRDKEERILDYSFDFPGEIHGMSWEADEAARCWSEGKLESETMGWEESLVIMQTMDEVRRQAGLTYPENIETTEYPVDLAPKGK